MTLNGVIGYTKLCGRGGRRLQHGPGRGGRRTRRWCIVRAGRVSRLMC